MYCSHNHFLAPFASVVAPPAGLSLLPASVDPPVVPVAVWPGLTYFFFLFF